MAVSLQVALHIPGAYNLTVHLPIMIGTVAFRRAHSYCFTQSRFYRETQAQFADMDFLPLPPPYRETITPPPPFEGDTTVWLSPLQMCLCVFVSPSKVYVCVYLQKGVFCYLPKCVLLPARDCGLTSGQCVKGLQERVF